MPWNVSADTITIESGPRRPGERFLRRYGLRIGVLAGLVEAVLLWQAGLGLLLVPIAIVAVVGYVWARRRLHPIVREPLRVVAIAQGVAGLVPLAIASILMAFAVVGVVAIIVVLLMIGRRRL